MANIPPSWIFPLALIVWYCALSFPAAGRFADDKPGRLASVDGLRGLLALSVLAHHFSITAQWQAIEEWRLTSSSVWNLFGQGAVALFFMITGFLFFGKIRSKPNAFDWVDFYKGRILRIYPVYLVVIVIVIMISLVFARDRTPTVPLFAHDLYHWLTFAPSQMLSMTNASAVVADVPWSLRYELFFYLSLPVFLWLWRAVNLRSWLILVLCCVSLLLVHRPIVIPVLKLDTRFFAPFLLGGAVSLVRLHGSATNLAKSHLGSTVVLASVAVFFSTQSSAYSVSGYLLLVCAFAPIALGNSVGGLLTSQPLRILGAASYDIYLLHGIVLFLLFRVLWPHGLESDALTSWIKLSGVGLLTISLSIVVHRIVEIPCMAISRRLWEPDARERLAAP